MKHHSATTWTVSLFKCIQKLILLDALGDFPEQERFSSLKTGSKDQ